MTLLTSRNQPIHSQIHFLRINQFVREKRTSNLLSDPSRKQTTPGDQIITITIGPEMQNSDSTMAKDRRQIQNPNTITEKSKERVAIVTIFNPKLKSATEKLDSKKREISRSSKESFLSGHTQNRMTRV